MSKPDTSIKDTFQGEIDTYLGIFGKDASPAKLELASKSFAVGAQCAVLLILKELFIEENQADAVINIHNQIEKWAKQNSIYLPGRN